MPTPRTDAFVMKEYGERPNTPLTASEMFAFACSLERELQEAERKLAAAERDAARYLDAIFAMADDGWLSHGPEGMDDVQKLVYEIAQEHPEYKRRAALSQEG